MSPTGQESASALKEAKDKLTELGIPFCLFLGTALGAYRDGDFCPGDTDDIDIAVGAEYYNRLPEIKEAFNDWVNYHNWSAPDGLCPESSFKKQKDGYYIKVDIFFIDRINDKMAWRFYLGDDGKNNITKYFDKKHFEKFDKVVFYNEEYNIPGEIEDYLIDNYGNWKTPIHRRNWDWTEIS